MDPTTDCPMCPKCALPTGITEGHDCAPLPSPMLRCAACGNVWEASAEDRAQAERADAAHEAKRRAEEDAGPRSPTSDDAAEWALGTLPGME